MRIAHVTDGYLPRLGGIETQVHDLARAQLAAGHDVEIVTATPAGPEPDALVVHRPALGPDRPAGGSTAAGTRRALDGRYDVVHVHLSIASPLGLSVLWRAAGTTPLVATMHSMWGPAEAALVPARRVLAGRTDAVTWTAVSSAAALPLRRSLGVPVAVVPNGVDVPWWADAPRAGQPRPGEGLRLLTVMRLCRRKRPLPLLRMLEAAATLAHCVPPRTGDRLSLTVVGDGRQADRVRRHAARSTAVDVRFTGRLSRPDIRSLTSEHDLYVAPAPLESFGLAALEARSSGLPVVAYRDSGVADFVRDGRDGVLVDDDRGLVAAVADLARRPEQLRRLQTAARSGVPSLGWSDTTAGYDEAYERALAGAGVTSGVAR